MDGSAEQAIRDRWDAYVRITLAKDVEGWASFWTPDARMLEPGMDLSGDDVLAFAKEFFESGGEVFSLDVESFEIFVHGDVAYQIGQYDEIFQAAGEDRMNVKNYFFARWEKQPDDVWKMSRFMAGPREGLAGS